MTLNAIWFVLLFILLGGYAVLDGFDLGIGVLHLFQRSDGQRRISINAIGPVWDGNEVWLLTGGGALFAAFPAVYATIFSGFYIALMLVLAALIFRAVSIEFRGKVDSARWRRIWDMAFGISSLLLAILFDVAFGNVLRGVPIGSDGIYAGTFFDLLNPFAILVGMLGLITFVMHGAIYLAGKTEPMVRSWLVRIAWASWIGMIVMFICVTLAGEYWVPSFIQSAFHHPVTWVLAVIFIAAIVAIPIGLKSDRPPLAFFASSSTIASMMALAAAGLFPRLLPALNDPSASLTIYNSSSSALTLRVMLVIALLGMPLVIAYTIVIHRVFRGKVIITPDSY